jgi:hypothetical protein
MVRFSSNKNLNNSLVFSVLETRRGKRPHSTCCNTTTREDRETEWMKEVDGPSFNLCRILDEAVSQLDAH